METKPELMTQAYRVLFQVPKNQFTPASLCKDEAISSVLEKKTVLESQ